MSNNATMTIGFLLIFMGIQLNVIDSYTLTPRATQFWAERIATPEQLAAAGYTSFQNVAGAAGQYFDPSSGGYAANNGYNNPFSQAGYSNSYNSPLAPNVGGVLPFSGGRKTIRTPEWVCWPVLFLGAVLCMVAFARRRL
ncbi:MAG: hypothetical protein AAF456_20960 [Planctomycetota bacterium]